MFTLKKTFASITASLTSIATELEDLAKQEQVNVAYSQARVQEAQEKFERVMDVERGKQSQSKHEIFQAEVATKNLKALLNIK